MIQNHIMSRETMSLQRSRVMEMPAQPQIVSRFRMPATPFMMFHEPPTMKTPSTMPCMPETWKSRITASRMLRPRIAGGNSNAYFMAAMRGL
ncbi:hypothetical protein D3C74_369720 [compost metagenome]